MYPTLHYAAECVTVPVTASSMYVNVCYCQQHVLLCLLLPPRCVTVPVTVNSMCVLYLLLIKACMLLCLLMLAAPIASPFVDVQQFTYISGENILDLQLTSKVWRR